MSCEKIRKNVINLTDSELFTFRDAVFLLKEQGNYDKYVSMHAFVTNLGHFGPAFFPWHRFFLLKFEQELQTINPAITLPYWDFTSSNFSGGNSQIWRTDFLGLNGNINLQWTGADGNLKSWNVKRDNFSLSGTPVSPSTLNSILNLSDYQNFRPDLEQGPHSAAHVFLGTDFGNDQSSFATAVNDPFFFLLHCNVDRIWADWQHRRKNNWQASNPNSLFTHSELTEDYFWLGTTTNTTWTTPVDRHNIDSILWPWDGTEAQLGNSNTAFSPWISNPENLSPRLSLNYQDLGYCYDSLLNDLVDSPPSQNNNNIWLNPFLNIIHEDTKENKWLESFLNVNMNN